MDKHRRYFNEEMHLARGIAIILVVLGHAADAAIDIESIRILKKVIFSFHMPVFFFISGFCGIRVFIVDKNDYSKILRKRFKRLMAVYLFLSVLAVFLKSLLPSLVNRPVLYSAIFYDVLVFPTRNPLVTLWFIYVLFAIQISFLTLHYFVRIRYDRLLHIVSMVTSVTLLGYLCTYLDVKVFGIETITYYSIFVLSGFIVRQYYRHVYTFIQNHKYWLLVVLTGNLYLLFGIETYLVMAYVAISGAFLVLVLCIIIRSKFRIILGPLTLMANYSYAIYLYSPLFELGGRVVLTNYMMLSHIVVFCFDFFLGLFCPILLSRYLLRKKKLLRGLSLGEW